MASLNITVDATKLLHDLKMTMDQVAIARLAELLQLSSDEAADWLVCKVAQFRGISEADVLALLVLEPPALSQQSQARGVPYYMTGKP